MTDDTEPTGFPSGSSNAEEPPASHTASRTSTAPRTRTTSSSQLAPAPGGRNRRPHGAHSPGLPLRRDRPDRPDRPGIYPPSGHGEGSHRIPRAPVVDTASATAATSHAASASSSHAASASAASSALPLPLAPPPRPRRRQWLGVAAVAALIGGAVGAGVTALADNGNGGNNVTIHESNSTPGAAVLSGNVTIPQLVRKVIPAVVSIDVKSHNDEDEGTGMIISSERGGRDQQPRDRALYRRR